MVPNAPYPVTIRLIAWLLCLCSLTGQGLLSARSEQRLIAVLKSREIAPYNTALAGFTRALENRDITPVFVQYDLEGAREKGRDAIKAIKASKPDLVFTIGTLATNVAHDSIKDTPIVFCMVLNPVAGGLVDAMNAPGGNITGASLDISPRVQFRFLKSVLPHMKTIGVLYHPAETSLIVTSASNAAKDMGMALIAHPVTSENDISSGLEKLKDRVDCLWSVPDTMIFSNFDSIRNVILFTLQNKIPFMGLSSTFVKSGALLAISCDIEDNGCQAGELAAKVFEGQDPADIPVATPRKTYLSLNARIAREIGVPLPPETVSSAKEVFK